jgi:ADP-ribose pyrophosphatase YjhB (NUDIX family)/GNAT superfamily N-acetyltransferase
MLPARYCPRCGTEMAVIEREGRARPVCPACGYVHYVNPVVAAGTLVERDGRVLLVRRGVDPGLGQWGLPAGYAEAGESPEETAIRETLEETGAVVETGELLGILAFAEPAQSGGVLVLYAARMVGGVVRPGDDALEARFFGARELPTEIAFATHRHALQQWARSRRFDYRTLAAADRPAWAAFCRELGLERSWPLSNARGAVEESTVAVAADDARVAGYAVLQRAAGQPIVQLADLQVAPAYRRWGIGTRLLAYSITLAAAQGALQLLAEMPADHPALIMFIHAGFRVCGFVERAKTAHLYLCHDLT